MVISQMNFKADLSSLRDIIQSFASNHYPHLPLDAKMLEQLFWAQNNSVDTSQSNVQSMTGSVNIEVKRILSRFNCLGLLTAADSKSYRMFIQSQPSDTCLSEESFARLAALITKLSKNSSKVLMATCFITKSDQAYQTIQAISAENRSSLPEDSEQFITYIAINFPKILPICALLTQESLQLLPFAFYKNAHARHILDMEGGYAMVSSIQEGILSRAITYEQYNLWFARWIINIAGLDGHINHQGSIYLREPVAQCILALKFELDQLWENPKHAVIDKYLEFRAKQLRTDSKYVAYLAALMRQYSPEMGHQIQSWFEALSLQQQSEKLHAFKKQLEQIKIAPTYKPTVLSSLLSLGCSVSETLTLFTAIEDDALQSYHTALATMALPEHTPLSFRQIAFKKELGSIRDFYHTHKKLPLLEIDPVGQVVVKQRTLQEEKTVAVQTPLLNPPKSPYAAVASRRNPCFGVAVVAYLEQNFPSLNAYLLQLLAQIIATIDPERKPENCPRKLPGFIKTKSLHASFYGPAPFLSHSDFMDFFKSQQGLDNGAVLEIIRGKLAQYLEEQEPRLIPVSVEFKEADGTILARCKVKTNNAHPRPMVALKQFLDSGGANAPEWDPNPLRDTTVAIVLCVVSLENDQKKINAIQAIIEKGNQEFQKFGEQFIAKYSIIKEYTKRTLTRGKKAEVLYDVEKNTSKPAVDTV